MNERGERCEPFVWGVDYGLTRGFICSPEYRGVLWHIGADGNDRGLTPEEPSPEMAIVSAPTREEYAEMFETLQAGLMRGDSFLANLTTATEVCLKGSLRDVFLTSRAPFRLLIPGEFVCFSPEPFVRVEGRGIATFPMKGTIDATLPDAERQLLDDYKETCEDHTITDLMRNDLNMVSDAVEVVRYRYVERVETMHGPILQTRLGNLRLLDRGQGKTLWRHHLPAAAGREHHRGAEACHRGADSQVGTVSEGLVYGRIRLFRRSCFPLGRHDSLPSAQCRRTALLSQRGRCDHQQPLSRRVPRGAGEGVPY